MVEQLVDGDPASVHIPAGGPLAGIPANSLLSNPGSNPSGHKPLTPHPSPLNCDTQFQGDRGLKIKKIHWGIVSSGKIMILQGVRHPISCLRVCYVNDPYAIHTPKGGCMAFAPTRDLTTSLRGDFHTRWHLSNRLTSQTLGQAPQPPPPLPMCCLLLLLSGNFPHSFGPIGATL